MNIIDLGAIDKLVKRNSNLLTAFKVIDEVENDVVVGSIKSNIVEFDVCNVISRNNIIDIVSENGAIPISYYFTDRHSRKDLDEILAEIRKFCYESGINYVD